MKAIFIFLFVTCCTCARAQDIKSVSILFNQTDTTYKFVEVTTTEDGDTVQIRFFPAQWLTADQFGEYLFQQAVTAEERKELAQKQKQEAQSDFDFYVATIDTIFGAGTYLNTVTQRVLNLLQGEWTLLEVQGKNKEKFNVTISGTEFTSGTTTAQIAVTDRFNFTLTGWLPVAPLNFKLRGNGQWVAKRGSKKYILKR